MSGNTFVIQKHRATSLHYDFRLEIGGVLVSWPVPKGPSTNPADRRLAMRVEDHPMEWGSFEGVIGPGYGEGPVIVWDRGTYDNLRDGESMEEGLAKGRLRFFLHGQKLHGGYSLRRFPRGGDNAWLLNKLDDTFADRELNIVEERPESVDTGRRIEELVS
jgi:DNA ligase D-like protein (predicted 3'-phosphoesterase)